MLRAISLIGLLGVLSLGCNANSSIGANNADGGEDDGGSGSSSPDFSTTTGGGSGDFCQGSGPPVLITPNGGNAGQACTGRLAEVAFRYGLCTCQTLNAGAQITVDAYDSQQAISQGSLGGSVGINGQLATASLVTMSGSLWVGDPAGMNFTSVNVGQELRCAGSAVGNGNLTVAGNAFVNGDANVGGALTVGGVLTLPAGKLVSGTSTPPRVTRAPVSVAAPCDCSADKLVNVAGYISTYQQQNDNATIFLDVDRLKNYNGNTTVTLPCGRFYLSGINGNGALTLQINGRVALFIGGDLQLSNPLTVNIATGASLDLFIGGQLNAGAALNLGSQQTASQLRIYMGSGADINLSSNVTLAGNLYAPLSQLNEGSNLTVYGALFVRKVAISGQLTIHHDTAIFRAGSGCPSPTSTGCTSCRDCGNQACTGGTCGTCTDSSQCCSPLQCVGGKCVYTIG